MNRFPATGARIAAIVAIVLLAAAPAVAQDVKVMTSGGFTAAYLEIVPEFERSTKTKVTTAFGASMGNAPDSIPSRLQRGEPVDVVIMAGDALDALIAQGKVVAGSRVDLVRSSIGMVVRAGAPKPDISSVAALTRTLLEAKSIAYSASASGVYLSAELFPRLGVADRIKGKAQRIQSERVAAVVARGDAEIGFQQISELLPVPGIDFVGPLPADAQRVTIFSAGLAAGAQAPEAGRALIRFLASQAAVPAIRKSGLEPMAIPHDRMPPIPADKLTAEQRNAIAEFRVARKAEMTGPFVPLLRSPEVMTRARAMGDYLRYKTALPPRLSEFVILMTSRQWSQQYEWNVHYPIALKAGLSPDVAAAIAEGRRPSAMTEEEAILYDFHDELSRNQSVSDATYARMVAAFGEHGLVDTVGIVGYYTMLAMMLNTARTPVPDNGVVPLPPLPR